MTEKETRRRHGMRRCRIPSKLGFPRTRRQKFRAIRRHLAKINYDFGPSIILDSCSLCFGARNWYCLEIYATDRAGSRSKF